MQLSPSPRLYDGLVSNAAFSTTAQFTQRKSNQIGDGIDFLSDFLERHRFSGLVKRVMFDGAENDRLAFVEGARTILDDVMMYLPEPIIAKVLTAIAAVGASQYELLRFCNGQRAYRIS